MARKYTKSQRWHARQTNRALGAAQRRSDKAMGKAFRGMGCAAVILPLLATGGSALLLVWSHI